MNFTNLFAQQCVSEVANVNSRVNNVMNAGDNDSKPQSLPFINDDGNVVAVNYEYLDGSVNYPIFSKTKFSALQTYSDNAAEMCFNVRRLYVAELQ